MLRPIRGSFVCKLVIYSNYVAERAEKGAGLRFGPPALRACAMSSGRETSTVTSRRCSLWPPVSAYKRILSQVAKDSDGCHDYVPEERSGVVPNGGDYLKGHGGVLEEKDAVGKVPNGGDLEKDAVFEVSMVGPKLWRMK